MLKRLFLLFLAAQTVFSFAQVSTTSPFSSRGIGDASFYGDARFMGIGGISTAIIDSTNTNFFNPASYSFVARGLPLFSLGIAHEEKTFVEGASSANGRFSSITQMGLAVPFGNRFGLAFGLKPYSRMGYEINTAEVVNNDSIFYDYLGKGEIQQFILGFSWKLVNRLNSQFSIGANGIRYFGRIENERRAFRRVNFNEVGAFDRTFIQAADFGYNLGAVYQFKPSSRHNLTLAATYQLNNEANMNRSHTRVHFGNFSNVNSYDTISALIRQTGTITIPEQLNIGFNYEFKAARDTLSRSGRLPSFSIAGEYSQEMWGSYQEVFGQTVNTLGFENARAYRFGFEYIPHRFPQDRAMFLKKRQKWTYRFGTFLLEEPHVIDGQQVMHVGASAGLGIPFVVNRAVSTLNLSVTYGQRGFNLSEELLRENYVGIKFGLNIAPSYDRWFTKSQID
jgi:hypothetical protein